MIMEENNNISRVSCSDDGPTTATTATITTTTTKSSNNNNNKKSRFATTTEDGGGLDCSGKNCKSCIAWLIADFVALCCCPCAVLHCFALAFVKAPWVVGKRCLRLAKNKNKNKKNKSKDKKVVKKKSCKRGYDYDDHDDDDDDNDDDIVRRNMRRNLRVDTNVVEEMDSVTINAAFEAEKVWLELYQIGHLDFGRVSSSND
ncbi:hypothetical protein TanjilG_04144 [Lupinus angustifolius]|uniref:Uncharacterized protein n=1 Tax=Lupinus angustifolius TaxID=3871 RepID=A0A4P1RJM8_LUPAN|nr:PREDICTED: uncharacterized protein LOC109347127 [Lupinus angustifolius]OIW12395.1 hypothetical protein TanjilG_04144 [Lupinus angustifolius]